LAFEDENKALVEIDKTIKNEMTTVLIEIEKEVQKLLQKTEPRQRGDTLEIVDPED
jgi:hypothetical protein